MFSGAKNFFNRAKEQALSLFDRAKNFIEDSKNKFENLYQTNYNTGMYHLEHGNLWDATLRFKIVKRFWPNQLDGQYQYAVCLVLQEMNGDAKLVLEDILAKEPDNSKAEDLLQKIETGKTKEMVDEFNSKFNREG